MTNQEAFSQLYFGIRFSVGGVQAHSVDLNYFESDGTTDAATNINFHPYSTTLQVGGHTITLDVIGSDTPPSGGTVLTREYTITADAPFWVVYTSALGQVITYGGTATSYNIVMSATQSPKRLRKGGNTSTLDLTNDLATLWMNDTTPNKDNMGGAVFADIQWCTHLPLRDPTTGAILRHPTTGVILRDD